MLFSVKLKMKENLKEMKIELSKISLIVQIDKFINDGDIALEQIWW